MRGTVLSNLATVRRRLEHTMSGNEKARISCRFSFKCPRSWDRLQPTAEEGVRHCHECDRDVHLALSDADVRRFSEQGRCIAVPVAQPDGEAQSDEPCYVVGRVMPAYDGEEEE